MLSVVTMSPVESIADIKESVSDFTHRPFLNNITQTHVKSKSETIVEFS